MRVIVFTLIFFISVHCVACSWIFIAKFIDPTFRGTWVAGKYEELNNYDLYWTAFYWAITTVTTVGYGDISGTNIPEKIFCAIIMVVGVIAFSFINGALISIIGDSEAAFARV